MKVLNPIKLFLVLAFAIVSFSSCEQDDESIYYYIIDRTWVGDLGFTDGYLPLESGITFKGDDYAVDRQYYYPEDGGRDYNTLNLKWWIDMGTLYLDYGRDYPLLEIRGVYISGRFLNGELYANGVYDYSVSLEMVD